MAPSICHSVFVDVALGTQLNWKCFMKPSVKEKILQLKIENAALKKQAAANLSKFGSALPDTITFITPIRELRINLKQQT
jgi:hypothetical protein